MRQKRSIWLWRDAEGDEWGRGGECLVRRWICECLVICRMMQLRGVVWRALKLNGEERIKGQEGGEKPGSKWIRRRSRSREREDGWVKKKLCSYARVPYVHMNDCTDSCSYIHSQRLHVSIVKPNMECVRKQEKNTEG